MNEFKVTHLCLTLSFNVLHTVSASAGMWVPPRPVPGGSRWDLLWRPVPHLGQLPVGAVPLLGR